MIPGRNFSTRERFYSIYRKIRFLARRGSLYSVQTSKVNGLVQYPKGTFRIISINSLVLFLLGYLVVYVLNLFTTAISANAFDIPVMVHYYNVDYLIRGNDWTSDAVTTVFSTGPLLALVLSITLLILYVKVAMETGIMRLLLLWMLLHSLTRFFGEILVGAIMSQGLGYVILYMFIMDTGKLIITIFAFVAMFTIGLLLTRQLLYSGNIYFNDLDSSNRFRFIWNQFLVPFFVGNILIFLFKLPEINPFDIALNGCMILFLIPVAMRSFTVGDDEPRKISFQVYLSAATLICIILFRIILGIGIRVG
jgi:hypothetical protein